uniref:Uncharacterized protein n=1 Tax=Arundo donax TaxID=35708 RepID=A0A0A8ZNU3_ARUDO
MELLVWIFVCNVSCSFYWVRNSHEWYILVLVPFV